jgi:hypothetical protein
MAELEIDDVINGIESVLRDMNYYLTARSFVNRGPLGEITENEIADYKRIMRSGNFLHSLLRKLDYKALCQVYRDCQRLANKNNWPSKYRVGQDANIELKTADYEHNAYYIDRKTLFGTVAGWEHQAPQVHCGYSDDMDGLIELFGFSIHATSFSITCRDGSRVSLRLWKGYYHVIGGEIGIYGWREGISHGDMKERLHETIDKFLDLLEIEDAGQGNIPSVDEMMNMSKEELRTTLYSLANSNWQLLLLRPALYNAADHIAEIRGILETDPSKAGESFDDTWGHSLESEKLAAQLGLEGTLVQVFTKRNNILLCEHHEYKPECWTTAFLLDPFPVLLRILPEIDKHTFKSAIYTVNHFRFKTTEDAWHFYEEVKGQLDAARDYLYNLDEKTQQKEDISLGELYDRTVVINYGKQER